MGEIYKKLLGGVLLGALLAVFVFQTGYAQFIPPKAPGEYGPGMIKLLLEDIERLLADPSTPRKVKKAARDWRALAERTLRLYGAPSVGTTQSLVDQAIQVVTEAFKSGDSQKIEKVKTAMDILKDYQEVKLGSTIRDKAGKAYTPHEAFKAGLVDASGSPFPQSGAVKTTVLTNASEDALKAQRFIKETLGELFDELPRNANQAAIHALGGSPGQTQILSEIAEAPPKVLPGQTQIVEPPAKPLVTSTFVGAEPGAQEALQALRDYQTAGNKFQELLRQQREFEDAIKAVENEFKTGLRTKADFERIKANRLRDIDGLKPALTEANKAHYEAGKKWLASKAGQETAEAGEKIVAKAAQAVEPTIGAKTAQTGEKVLVDGAENQKGAARFFRELARKYPKLARLVRFGGKFVGPVGGGLLTRELVQIYEEEILIKAEEAKQEVATAIQTRNGELNSEITAIEKAITKILDELPIKEAELAKAKSGLLTAQDKLTRLKAVDTKNLSDLEFAKHQLELAEAERQVENIGEEGAAYVEDGTGTLGLITEEIARLKIELKRLLDDLEATRKKQSALQKDYDKINAKLERLKTKLYQYHIDVPEGSVGEDLLSGVEGGIETLIPGGASGDVSSDKPDTPLGIVMVTERKNGQNMTTFVGLGVNDGTIETESGKIYKTDQSIPSNELRDGFTYEFTHEEPTGDSLLPGVSETVIETNKDGVVEVEAKSKVISNSIKTQEDLIQALMLSGILPLFFDETPAPHILTITAKGIMNNIRLGIPGAIFEGKISGDDFLELGNAASGNKKQIKVFLTGTTLTIPVAISYTDKDGNPHSTTFNAKVTRAAKTTRTGKPTKTTKPTSQSVSKKVETGAIRPAKPPPSQFEGYQTGPRSPQIFTPTESTRPPLHTF